MVISTGEKVHIITRRLFEEDLRRHFVGVVETCTETTIRVNGWAFVFDQAVTEFTRRDGARTRVFSLTSAGLIIGVLPGDVDLEKVRYRADKSGGRVLTDDQGFEMNISEFGATR